MKAFQTWTAYDLTVDLLEARFELGLFDFVGDVVDGIGNAISDVGDSISHYWGGVAAAIGFAVVANWLLGLLGIAVF